MLLRFAVRPHSRPSKFAKTIVVSVMLLSLFADSARAIDFSVGGLETIYSKSQRSSKSLGTWPDGNFGVVPLGNGQYDFYAANGSKPVKTTGTLTNPGTSKKSVSITNLPKGTFNYVSGGPVYQDTATGARVMIYHAEKHGKSAKDFYSVLGMAVSTDAAGRTFRDLGTIVEPNMQTGQTEVTGGTFAVINGQMNVYYRDWFPNGTTSELAVASAPINQVISNALSGVGTSFNKYYNGSFSQPGRGGLSTALEAGNPSNAWMAVSYNDYLNQLVMVSSQWTPTQPDLYLSTSSDGINWSPRQAVVTDPGEQFYPSMIGTGANPQITGKSFYLYYTDSKKGSWSRWNDAKLVRREITLDLGGSLPATSPGGSGVVIPPSGATDWSLVSDYASDFQAGTPSSGWRYAWNPAGVTGVAATYQSLQWSNTAQAYNTTGGATPVPGLVSHRDDYLNLTSWGGHPGQPKYMPIAGYTIQTDDGAGEYRLSESSISKIDSLTSTKEDGLGVLVYVNNTRIGTTASVSTNGALAGFDQNLGQLKVGDTVWVMVDPLATQYNDSFMNFDFSIQKAVSITAPNTQAFSTMLAQGSAVPEPGSLVLVMLGVALCGIRRPRRRC